MATSRSRFYVDTPTNSSQRHSMFVYEGDVNLSPASSSATLPSTAGSVDRLTGVGEKNKKKSHRFFTLKPKTSFSLRPFFSTTSLKSSKHRKSVDSCVQTDSRVFGEIGVQTQNTSTVDVPVQTCNREWEDGKVPVSYGRGPLATYKSIYQRWPSAGYSSSTSAIEESKAKKTIPSDLPSDKQSFLTPLDSSKLLKYAAPVDTTKPSPSTDINNADRSAAASQEVPEKSTVPKPITVSKICPAFAEVSTNQPQPLQASFLESSTSENDSKTSALPKVDSVITCSKTADDLVDFKSSNNSNLQNETSLISVETNTSPRNPSPCPFDRPPSALKIERTDSPVRQAKTVHFDLPDSNCNTLEQAKEHKPQPLPKNLEKEFEDLLRNLDIISDEPGDEQNSSSGSNAKFHFGTTLENPLKQTSFSAKLHSAFDILHQDPLPPIFETANESSEANNFNQANALIEPKFKIDATSNITKIDLVNVNSSTGESLESKCPLSSELDEKQNKHLGSTAPFVESTSSTIFIPDNLKLDAEDIHSSRNVYDDVIKENCQKVVQLPTLPSFFNSTAPNENTLLQKAHIDSEDSDKEGKMLSRSSSRCSIKSNSKAEMDFLLDSNKKFESCENLDQLEEEIIRSLSSPCEDKCVDYSIVPSESVVLSRTKSNGAFQARSAILDQLLRGGNVKNCSTVNQIEFCDEIVNGNNQPSIQGKRHFATLNKIEYNVNNSFDAPQINVNDRQNCNSTVDNSNEISSNCTRNTQETHYDNFSQAAAPTGISTVTDRSSNGQNFTAPYNNYAVQNFTTDGCLNQPNLYNSNFFENSDSETVITTAQNTAFSSPSSKDESNTDGNINGQCDYTNCLKPSQFQRKNANFTEVLSEITSNKWPSRNDDVHSNKNSLSTLSQTMSFPTENRETFANHHEMDNESTHKSECTIILKPPQIYKPELCGNSSDSGSMQDTNVAKNAKPNPEYQNVSRNDYPNVEGGNIPPPPPPPPSCSGIFQNSKSVSQPFGGTLESHIQNRPNFRTTSLSPEPRNDGASKTPLTIELEKRFEKQCSDRIPNQIERDHSDILMSQDYIKLDTNLGKENEKNGEYLSHSPVTAIPYQCNGNYNISSNLKGRSSSLPNGNIENSLIKKDHTISTNSIVTDAPPPPGAVLLEKKITIEGDKVHTDKYYAIPVKEILKEKTTTTKYIAAPPKYDGIGPTEDGVPTGLRQSVKKENMHNWYKTMFKSLHKSDSSNDPQEYIVGYSSEPETNSREKAVRKKSSTLDHRSGRSNANHLQGYPASARSSIETYKVRPRLIEDYEPGHSSVTDDEITIGSKRFLPASNVPKTSYEYKNGYDQENHLRRNLSPSSPSPEQQKVWYKDIQKGGEVPQFGLGKNAPEKYRDPVIGPLPPPPMNYNGPITPQQATRPLSLPKDYINYNNNNFCQQSNGVYEIQMRQAIHDELHHRLSPASSALSSPSRSMIKSPSRSPDLKLPARVLFDFNAESSKEVSLKKGEMVLILRQLDKNWYEGEHNGYIGIFPISYVEIIPPEHTLNPIKNNSEGVGKVLYDFIAQTSLELSARKGDAVNLLRRVDLNWYEVRVNNRKGIIPASYLQILEEPYERSAVSPTLKSCLKSPSRSSSETRDVSKANSLSPYSMNSSPIPIFENGQNKIRARSKKGSGLIEPVMYKAIYSYVPQNTDELEILEGDTVYVVEMCDDGWYVGTSVRTGQFGIFPGNYVDKA